MYCQNFYIFYSFQIIFILTLQANYTQCQGKNADNYQQFDEITENSQIQDFIIKGTLTIPCGVTIVDQQVQQLTDKSQITEIILPDTLQTIQNSAFSGLTSLTEIIIPESVTSIGSGAFQGCTQLDCVAILNQGCSIDETAFQNTPLNETYMKNVGDNATCPFDYNETDTQIPTQQCDGLTYIYIVNISEPTLCTTVDNVQYFYKTEIDEEEVNVRVDSCEQISYQYQIQGTPIECVENCNGYTYIQEQFCVNECDEEHDFIQNGECVISCTIDQYPYIQGNECVAECTGEYAIPTDYPTNQTCSDTCNYYQVNDTTKQCINDCSEAGVDYIYIKYDNEQRDRYQCVTDCQYYQYTNESFTVCTQTLSCENITVDGQQLQYVDDTQCVDSCQYNKYYLNGSNTHCTQDDNCQGIEVDEEQLQYLEGEFCVADCSLDYPVKDDTNKTCSNTCNGGEGYVEDGVCIQQCTEGRFVADMQQTLYTCVSNCGELDPPKYGNTLSNPQQCIEDCNTTTYKYSQDFICVEQCTGDYAKPYEQESGQCSTTCAFMNNDDSNKECVSNESTCPDNMYLVQQHNNTRDECTDTTQYYITLNNQTKQVIAECNNTYPYLVQNVTYQPQECVESCELIPDYNIFNEHTKPKQCVNNCTGEYSYIQDKYCESGCTGDHAYPIDYPTDNLCDKNCMYYINENNKYCTNECNEQGQEYILNDPVRQYCVSSCQGQDTYNLEYIDEQGIRYCVDQCPEGYIDQNGTCELDEPEIVCEEGEYVQNNQCVDQCNGEYAKPVSGNICDNQCKYYTNITDNVKYCVDTDCPEEYPYYADLERDQCVSNCNETTLTYSEEYTCVQQCSGEYAEPQDTNNKICDQSCKYYTNDNNKYCMDPCSGSYSFTVDLPDTQRDYCVSDCSTNNDGYNLIQGEYCVQQCSPGYEQTEEGECVASCQPDEYLQNGECVEQCTGEYAIPIDGNICSNTCTYYQDTETSKQCVDECTDPHKYYYQQGERYQCISNCEDVTQYTQDIYCVEECTGDYAYQPTPSSICDNSCAFESAPDDKKDCVSENGTCPDNLFLVQQYNQTRDECVHQTSHYALLENGTKQALDSCSDNYTFTVIDDQNPIQCTDDCQKTNQTLIQNSNECVSECSEEYEYIQGNVCSQSCNPDYKYIQGKFCSQNCSEDYAYPIEQNGTIIICSNSCMYYTENGSKYCTEQCEQGEYIVNDPVRQYCVIQCQSDSEYRLQHIDNGVYYCVSECPSNFRESEGICVENPNSLSTGAIVGIVIAVIVIVVLIIIIVLILLKKKQQKDITKFAQDTGKGKHQNRSVYYMYETKI